MPWIAAVGALGGAALGADAAGDAADAQERMSRRQMDFYRQMYMSQLGMNEPWRATGMGANNNLARLFGLPYQDYQSATSIANQYGGSAGTTRFGAKAILKMMKKGMSVEDIAHLGTLKDGGQLAKKLAKHGLSAEDIGMLQQGPNQFVQQAGMHNVGPNGESTGGPDMSVFTQSPGYQFRRDEGMRDIGSSFAARGGAFSGNALRGLSDFNQNLASNEFGNYVNQMLAISQGGQAANQQSQQAGNYFSGMTGQAMQNQGDARASGIANQANMWGQGLSGLGYGLGQYYQNRQAQQNFNPSIQNNAYLNRQFGPG